MILWAGYPNNGYRSMSWETTELSLSDPFNSTVKQYADNAPYQYTEYDHLPESRIILQQDAGEAWKK